MPTLHRVLKVLNSGWYEVYGTISASTRLESDLELEDLDIVFLIQDLEEEFDVEIDEREWRRLVTVEDVAELIDSLLS